MQKFLKESQTTFKKNQEQLERILKRLEQYDILLSNIEVK